MKGHSRPSCQHILSIQLPAAATSLYHAEGPPAVACWPSSPLLFSSFASPRVQREDAWSLARDYWVPFVLLPSTEQLGQKTKPRRTAKVGFSQSPRRSITLIISLQLQVA